MDFSSSRHLTAGFLSAEQQQHGAVEVEQQLKAMVQRLGRELSAMALSADSWYLSLSNKRSVILRRIVVEYEREWRAKGMALLNAKTLPDESHSLLTATVNSSVFFMR